MDPTNTQSFLCVKGCGFFATAENNNLCSKCYKDSIKESFQKHKLVLEIESDQTEESPAGNPKVPAEETAGKKSPARERKQTCKVCKRKIGLLGFDCRCGNVFCGSHRHPDEHSCPSDYKESARLVLAKQNPLINSDKLDRL